MSDAPSFMAQFGARLIDHGYPVIPIMPGAKVPGRYRTGRWSPYPGWTRHCDRATTSGEVEIWSRWPGCGIGIAGGGVVGLDIDVPDAALAVRLTDVAGEMLGATPCLRIGRAPKRLLVYRAAAPFPGRKRHPVEALARGQQFVAFAIHPDTGQPYAWPDESPLDVPLADLPAVDEARCLAFLDAAWRLLPEELRQTALVHDAPTSAWRGPSDPRGTREAIVSALAHLPNTDLAWDDWFRIGMALKGALGEEGRDLWLAWSRSSGKSGKSGRTDTAERLWASARPHSIGAGTIYWLAEQRGWSPPAELTLNAKAAERAAQPHPASALLARIAAAPAKDATPVATYQVPPELLAVDGALGRFIDYATRTAVSPQPFLALGAGLCLLGALAGRRYRTPTDLRSNLYAIGIADSGGGKDHARRCIKRALYAAGLERYLGGEDLASSAGLLTSLQLHPARIYQVDEFGQFLRLGEVRLVEDDDARTVPQITEADVAVEHGLVGGELGLEGFDVADRVTARVHRGCVDHVHEHGGALDVAQEVQAQSLALRGAGDQSGHVSHGEGLVPDVDHAQVRGQRGERVVGDLRLRGRKHRDERGLAGGGETDEADVGHRLQLQDDVVLLARFAVQGETGGLTLVRGQGRVAQAAETALGGDEAGARHGQVGENVALLRHDDCAHRHLEDEVFAAGAVAVRARAVAATPRPDVRTEVEVHQGVGLRGHLEDDVAAMPAVASVGSAERLELLAVDGHAAVATVTCGEVQDHAVYEAGHGGLPSVVFQVAVNSARVIRRPAAPQRGAAGSICFNAA